MKRWKIGLLAAAVACLTLLAGRPASALVIGFEGLFTEETPNLEPPPILGGANDPKGLFAIDDAAIAALPATGVVLFQDKGAITNLKASYGPLSWRKAGLLRIDIIFVDRQFAALEWLQVADSLGNILSVYRPYRFDILLARSTRPFFLEGGMKPLQVGIVPEPASLALYGMGLAWLCFFMRRRQRHG